MVRAWLALLALAPRGVGATDLAQNVVCLPHRSDEAIVDFSAATLLHANLGNVAHDWCAAKGTRCVTDASGLTRAACSGQVQSSPCFQGMVVGDVFDAATTQALTGGVAIDLWIVNTSHYFSNLYESGTDTGHHQSKIKDKFAQVRVSSWLGLGLP